MDHDMLKVTARRELPPGSVIINWFGTTKTMTKKKTNDNK